MFVKMLKKSIVQQLTSGVNDMCCNGVMKALQLVLLYLVCIQQTSMTIVKTSIFTTCNN